MYASRAELITPRILAIDDERQVHASLRLRLAGNYDLVSSAEPRSALSKVEQERFDLCIVDLHMPGMDGLDFVEAARQIDPCLGFVILSGHGTEENLRRAIPLQVYDFILKPLPDRAGFEQRLPEWIERTRTRRQEMILVKDSSLLVQELDAAQIDRDIEFTASESARDALLQSANLLTTIHALLASAANNVDGRLKRDATLGSLARTLQEATQAAEAATSVTEGFFNSVYANRDTSAAHLGDCLAHAGGICTRWARADQDRKHLDITGHERNAIIRDLSGIELLLMLVPILGAALEATAPGTTVQVYTNGLNRLDAAPRGWDSRSLLWVNRKHAAHSHAGIALGIRARAAPLQPSQIRDWLEGRPACPIRFPARGLLHGLAKCRGMLGFSTTPTHEHFELLLALPT